MIFSLEPFTESAAPKFSKKENAGAELDPARADICLDAGLMGLVRLRVVQILGCKRCMREYSAILKESGETEKRLRHLQSWRRESAFTLREKAALNLAEAVTRHPFSSIPPKAIDRKSVV